MAQMPRTAAEELAAKLRTRMEKESCQGEAEQTKKRLNQFDLVISGAQVRQSSPLVDLSYHKFNNAWDLTPVVTPYPAYRQERCDKNDSDDDCKDGDGYLPSG